MDTHSMIFVTVDKLISPSSSVDGDPLDDFPDHWQPRFSAQFLLRRTSEGADCPAPSKQTICPLSASQAGCQAVRSVVSLASFTRQDAYSQAWRQLDALRTA